MGNAASGSGFLSINTLSCMTEFTYPTVSFVIAVVAPIVAVSLSGIRRREHRSG